VTSKAERAPDGLDAAGARLWRDVMGAYECDPGEREVLLAACRTVDELVALEAALAGADAVVLGSQGQPRPNPLYEELRRHRAAFAQLIAALRLPTEAARSASELGSHAAMSRWRNQRRGA
jgi:hypothetical protein